MVDSSTSVISPISLDEVDRDDLVGDMTWDSFIGYRVIDEHHGEIGEITDVERIKDFAVGKFTGRFLIVHILQLQKDNGIRLIAILLDEKRDQDPIHLTA